MAAWNEVPKSFLRCAALLCCMLGIAACAGFNPQPFETLTFKERATTQERGGVTVSAVALSPAEAQAAFGVATFDQGIQPVWLRVTNGRKATITLLPLLYDPLYFTPAEAAFIHHGWFSADTNDAIDKIFAERALPLQVKAGETIEGFLYGMPDLGQKALNLVFVGESESIHLSLIVPVPGLDREPVDFSRVYAPEMIRDISTGPDLKAAIEALPCCVTDASGTKEADPLNFVIIADLRVGLAGFVGGGWDQAEVVTGGSAMRTFESFIFGSAYRYSPVSDLYVFGRRQDAAAQVARSNIHERNHLRIWLTPLTFRGVPVWIGAISRDIGVIRSGFGTTHKIDPHVDGERWFLAQSLIKAQALKRFAFVGGGPVSTPDNPRSSVEARNIFYSDGQRIVMELSVDPIPMDKIEFLNR